MGHVIPVRESRKGIKFILGRVIYPRTNPKDVRVKVIKPGEPKIIVGKKGVYVLDDTLAEEVIKEAWKEYLKKYKSPGSKAGKDVLDRPVEITEKLLRECLRKKGIGELYIKGMISFNLEGSDIENVFRLVEELKNKTPAGIKT